MATTQEDIRQWLLDAKAQGATHLIVACDTFDHDDYPVFVMPGEDAKAKFDEYQDNSKHPMQIVMECYSLKLDIETQLAERRARHFE